MHIEASIAPGMSRFRIVGIKDYSASECVMRIRSALASSGFSLPKANVTVNIAPDGRQRFGSDYDLPIAAAILAATRQIPTDGLERLLLVGELGLGGSIQGVRRGELAYRKLARETGLTYCCPAEADISLLRLGADSFSASMPKGRPSAEKLPVPDFSEVIGNENAKRACMLAAAGGHGLLLMGPKGSDKAAIARRMAGILPPMTEAEAEEAANIASLCGEDYEAILAGERPFRAPHFSCSIGGMVGGGRPIFPGEVSLAHNGVLFLDELGEWETNVLGPINNALNDHEVRLVRVDGIYRFPAATQLVAAACPCPCGHLGDAKRECTDSAPAIYRYQERLGGPLQSQLDLSVGIEPTDAFGSERPGLDSASMADLVMAAQERRAARESALSDVVLDRARRGLIDCLAFDHGAFLAITDYAKLECLGGAAIARIARIARTVADFEGHAYVEAGDVIEACAYTNKFAYELCPVLPPAQSALQVRGAEIKQVATEQPEARQAPDGTPAKDSYPIESCIPNRILDAFEEHSIKVFDGNPMEDGTVYFEVEWYTPAGGDNLGDVYVPESALADESAWANAIADMVKAYDPWEEAHKWLDDEGNPVPDEGIPFAKGIEVYQDCLDGKRETLEALIEDVRSLGKDSPIDSAKEGPARDAAEMTLGQTCDRQQTHPR